MSSVNVPSPHLLELFDLALRRMRSEMDAVMEQEARGLRSSQLRLLSLTPPDGMRVTDLAARAGMTKQALGELVSGLQATGHVEVETDRVDRRVRLVRPTPQGLRLRDHMHEAIAALEGRLAQRTGRRRWATFRAVLAEVGGDAGPA